MKEVKASSLDVDFFFLILFVFIFVNFHLFYRQGFNFYTNLVCL